MRTEAEPELSRHAVRWFLPAEFLRGLLIAAVLYPLFDTLKSWRFGKRFLMVASLYVVLGFWAAAVPAPGTIEGMVYLRPFVTPHGRGRDAGYPTPPSRPGRGRDSDCDVAGSGV